MRRHTSVHCLVVAAILTASTPVSAQSWFGGGSVGYAHTPESGGAVSVFVGTDALPLRVQLLGDAVLFTREPAKRYGNFYDRFGRRGCFDSEEQVVVHYDKCETQYDFDLAPRTEVLFRVPGTQLTLGPGIRVGDDVTPYVTVGAAVRIMEPTEVLITGRRTNTAIEVKFNLGPGFSQFDIAIRTPL